MKKIIFSVIVFIIVFLIYYFNSDKRVYYLSIGDYLSFGIDNFENSNIGYSDMLKENYKNNLKRYVNYSSIDDYRVMDLTNDINYNKVIKYNNKNYKIQNLLIKANLITISIGMNDIINKKNIDYEYIDNLLKDIDKLLILIRKYNKDKIYLLGYYNIINNQDLIEYTNNKLKSICNKNRIIFVDISELTTYIKTGIYPTREGYRYITDTLLNS